MQEVFANLNFYRGQGLVTMLHRAGALRLVNVLTIAV